MNYVFEYVTFYGRDPNGHPIKKNVKIKYESMDEIHKWIKSNMPSQSIWWISYKIFCHNVLIEEKQNNNLDKNYRSIR